ncbi:MAG: T9SS type A sorting domain-containing protein [Chloroflexota bacterium]|nr:T9SS type A sorting domain-containing protein [Lentimicrobium sp.]
MKKFFTLLALVVISYSSFAQWIPQASGFTTASRGIQYMDAVNDQVVWASAYDGSGTGATINEFTRTVDGGDTWVPGDVLGGTTYGIGNICGISADIAYVALYKGSGNQDNTCGVYKTSDGGVTWTQLPGALQGSASFANNVYFWNEQEGMCHGDVRDNYFEIYYTTNGGTTWTRVPAANIANGTPLSGEGGWTSVIEAVGDSTIIFGTNKGRVLISHDRGITWRASVTGITAVTNGGINEIAFVDENHGLVAQTATTVAVRRTNDGGLTWEPVTPTGAFLTNDLIAVPGTESTYVSTGAATDLSGISFSYDGVNWEYFTDTEGIQFLAADFIDPFTGWVGAFNESATVGGMYKFNGSLIQPMPPTNLTYEVTGQVFVNLTWNSPVDLGGNLLGYNVWRNGTIIQSLITDTTYVNEVTVNGGYSYMVTAVYDNGESEPTNTVEVEITGVGVNSPDLIENLRVYPNPASDIINIKADESIIKLQLVNIAGQIVYESNAVASETVINTSDLTQGLYMLNITSDKGTVTRKISIR